MLRFFRVIREKLILQGKVKSYLLYAVGEILLVVIGILIALQVNNWNEERKLNQERTVLIESINSDFTITRTRLKSSMTNVDKLILRLEKFLSVAYQNNSEIPMDSLKYWLGGAFELAQIEPLLTSYNEAVSTGKIGLIQNQSFSESVAEFLLAYKFYEEHVILSGTMFYHGSTWEIRKEVGTLQILEGIEDDRSKNRLVYPDAYPMTDSVFRAYIAQPHVFAAFENFLTIHYNIRDMFVEMDTKTIEIIEQLDIMITETTSD